MITPLTKKLRLHTVEQALILNAPEGYFDVLGELPTSIDIHDQADPETEYEYVQAFVKTGDELQHFLPQALSAIKFDGLLWICYPKKNSKLKSDLSRDIVWEMTKGTGIRPVTQVSIDETWSALRFRPDQAVGK